MIGKPTHMFDLHHRRKAGQIAISAVSVLPLFAASYYAAFLLRFAGEPTPRAAAVFFDTLLWVAIIKWASFVWFRLHQGWSRFVGFEDLIVLGQSVTCATLGITIFDAICLSHLVIPRSIILIDWGVTLLLLGAVRALPRLVRRETWSFLASGAGTRCLIVGADCPGETLLRYIRNNPALTYRVVGLIDNRPALAGCRISGVPVLGACDELPQIAQRFDIQEVLIMSGGLPGKQVRELVDSAQRYEFRVKVLPSFQQLLEERVAVHPRSVAIEDLLCRESVQLDLASVRDWIAGRTVMVTGSAGSIGAEISRQLLKLNPASLVLVDRSETGQFHLERELKRLSSDCGLRIANCGLTDEQSKPQAASPGTPWVPQSVLDVRLADLTDFGRLETLFEETRPEIIIHAAAYKHVPLMESHCGEAVKNIILATRNLVDLANDYNARALVMISTDKAVNPTSVMGSCKRLAEQYVQARSATSTCRFVTVRFGNVLDSSGSVVPIFREQIAAGGPVTVTHSDITRYFMLIPEAAQLVLQAGAMGKGGEIFVLDMGEPVRILDLAQDMIRLSGFRVGDDIEIQIVGLRPGEKLFEELYDSDENRHRTNHPKILVASSRCRDLAKVTRDINRLASLREVPNDILKAALREMINSDTADQFVRQRIAA
jgi:FlaA1/EpsC-like NDP-sugar epimerase